MVQTCILCKKKYNKEDSISFHLFPVNPARKKLWMKACGLNEERLRKAQAVCSKHFESTCFRITREGGPRLLKRSAVPSIFTHRTLKKKKKVIQDNMDLDKITVENTVHMPGPETILLPVFPISYRENNTTIGDNSQFFPRYDVEPGDVEIKVEQIPGCDLEISEVTEDMLLFHPSNSLINNCDIEDVKLSVTSNEYNKNTDKTEYFGESTDRKGTLKNRCNTWQLVAINDLTVEHFKSKAGTKKQLKFIQEQFAEKQKCIRSLSEQNRRLLTKVTDLESLVDSLKNKESLSNNSFHMSKCTTSKS